MVIIFIKIKNAKIVDILFQKAKSNGPRSLNIYYQPILLMFMSRNKHFKKVGGKKKKFSDGQTQMTAYSLQDITWRMLC